MNENKNRTQIELKQIALDITHGRIFGDWQIDNFKDMQIVFMPLALIDKAEAQKLLDDGVEHIFEYMRFANPRISINGYPVFASYRTLNNEETEHIRKYVNELVAAEKKFMQD